MELMRAREREQFCMSIVLTGRSLFQQIHVVGEGGWADTLLLMVATIREKSVFGS